MMAIIEYITEWSREQAQIDSNKWTNVCVWKAVNHFDSKKKAKITLRELYSYRLWELSEWQSEYDIELTLAPTGEWLSEWCW